MHSVATERDATRYQTVLVRFAHQGFAVIRVRNRYQRQGALRNRFSFQINDAVFGDHDVAQVARDGHVAVVPDDAAVQAVGVVVRGAQQAGRRARERSDKFAIA